MGAAPRTGPEKPRAGRGGRSAARWAWPLGVLLGLAACAATGPPPSPLEGLLSGLPDVRYRATLVFVREGDVSRPLAVVLDPEGGPWLSVLPISFLEVDTEVLGELGRKDLIARLKGVEGKKFGGGPLRYAEGFARWGLRPVLRMGAAVGRVMSVDPRLRFEIRAGPSGRVYSLLLRPSAGFEAAIEGGE